MIQRMRHQLSLDVCNGSEWQGLTAGVDGEEKRQMDSWSEVDTFEVEDEDEEEMEEEKREMEQERLPDTTHTNHNHNHRQERRHSSARSSRRGSRRSTAVGLCPHQLPFVECMTCALQSHTSTLHAQHSVQLHHVHALLSSLHSQSLHHSSHDKVSYGYFRYGVGSSLMDSTINHLTFLDEPVRLLGLVVNQQLVMQVLAALVTAGAGALSSIVPGASTS